MNNLNLLVAMAAVLSLSNQTIAMDAADYGAHPGDSLSPNDPHHPDQASYPGSDAWLRTHLSPEDPNHPDYALNHPGSDAWLRTHLSPEDHNHPDYARNHYSPNDPRHPDYHP
jgi:hypothetical protein